MIGLLVAHTLEGVELLDLGLLLGSVATIHLTDEWYQKIANGEKTEEYRECSLYWTKYRCPCLWRTTS